MTMLFQTAFMADFQGVAGRLPRMNDPELKCLMVASLLLCLGCAARRTPDLEQAATACGPGPCRRHGKNLMNPKFRTIAVACARNDAATYRLYWTMTLGWI